LAGVTAGRKPHVAVVVLNWNNLSDTIECLASILSSDYDRLSVWLIDNASTDDPTAAVRAEFPSVRIVRLPQNLGYSGGNNAGLRLTLDAGADYVLLANNDVVVSREMIGRLVTVAQARPEAGFVTPRIRVAGAERLYWDGGTIDWATGDVDHESSTLPRRDGIVESQWSNGCCPLVRATMIHDVGAMDERFFLYYEDVDWSFRASQRGWRHLVVPDAECRHKVSRSTGGIHTPRSRFYFARNRYLVLQKHSPHYSGRLGGIRYSIRILQEYGWYRDRIEVRRAIVEASLSLIEGRWGEYHQRSRIVTMIADGLFYVVSVVASASKRVLRARNHLGDKA
jgi:GT2 family glycosyltransferase